MKRIYRTLIFCTVAFFVGYGITTCLSANGQENNGPNIPPIIEENNEYQDVLNTLYYDYHPNIEQWQIDFAFDWLNAKCLQQFSEVNVFIEISCTGMNSGILGGALEEWGYTIMHPTPTGKAPQLIN